MADEPSVQLEFELLENRVTNNIVAYTVDSAYFTPTDGWDVEYFETDFQKTRKLELQPVKLYVNGRLQVVGRVDATEVGDNGHAVTLQGRDYLSDLTECNIDPSIKLKKEMTLEKAILLACSPAGITKVIGDRTKFRNIQTGINVETGESDAGFLENKVEEYKAEPGEGMYEFCNRILARHGATMQPTDRRDTVALVAPNYVQSPIATIIRHADNPHGAANNVISAVARRDFSNYPTHVMLSGRENKAGEPEQATFIDSLENGERALTQGPNNTKPSALNGVLKFLLPDRNADLIVVDRVKPGQLKPKTEALYRLLYMRDEQSRTQEQLNRVLYRAASERIKNSLQYSVTLRGHIDPTTGATYAPDTIVEVQDEVCDVYEKLWVEKRTFGYDDTSGPHTKLVCWRIGSFLL